MQKDPVIVKTAKKFKKPVKLKVPSYQQWSQGIKINVPFYKWVDDFHFDVPMGSGTALSTAVADQSAQEASTSPNAASFSAIPKR